MINQLFINKPTEAIIIRCVELLGWVSFTDKRILIRTDLDNLQIAAKFKNIINELRQFYLPCKQDKYLSIINTKSVITIVRQLLKTIGYNIRGIEKVIDNKKEMIYKLEQYTKIPHTPTHIVQSNITTQPQQSLYNAVTHTGQSKFIVCWN
jgi:hypothetical protein